MSELDPLDLIHGQTLDTQVAVLRNEIRNQRALIADLKSGLRSVQIALWGLVITLLGITGTLIAVRPH